MFGKLLLVLTGGLLPARSGFAFTTLCLFVVWHSSSLAQGVPSQSTVEASSTPEVVEASAEARFSPHEIRNAIDQLSSRTFGKRQAAYRLLVEAGVEAIDELELGARRSDLDIAERCVKALSEIAADDEAIDAVVAALQRLSKSKGIRVTLLARKEAERLKMTDEDRAVAALEAAGVRIHRMRGGEIFSVAITRDQDMVWLKFLPTLRSLSLMQGNVTDAGIGELVDCDQIQRLSLYRTGITDAGLAQLKEIASLNSISLSGNQFSPTGIRALKKVQGLRSLLWNSAVDTDQLQAISELRQISTLTLSSVPSSDEAIGLLNQLDFLSRLGLTLRDADDDLCSRLSKINVEMTLSMMDATEITSKGWQDVSKMKLTLLMIYRSSLTDSEMPLIGKITTLTNLTIYDSPISDDGILELEKLTNLQMLNLRRTMVSKSGADRLKKKLPNLRSVRVDPMPAAANPFNPAPNRPFYGVTNSLGRKNVHLRVPLTDAVFAKLKQEKDVHTVFMTRSLAKDASIALVAKLPIKGLVVDSDSVSDAGLQTLRNHKTLESLSVNSKALTDACSDTIIDIPSLTQLSLFESQLTDLGAQRLITGLAKVGKLTSLQLGSTPNLTDEALKGIRQLETLEQLQFSNNPNADASVLRYVRDATRLNEVRIDGGTVSAEDVRHLSGLKVKRIVFGGSRFGPNAISALVEACPKLESLSLAKSSVVDDDLLSLAKLGDLERLWLYGTKVGDEGLKHLDDLKKLQSVHVNAAHVTADGERRFKEKHPDADLRRN